MTETLKQIQRVKKSLQEVVDNSFVQGVFYSSEEAQAIHSSLLKDTIELLDDAEKFNKILETAANDSLASDGLEMIYSAMEE